MNNLFDAVFTLYENKNTDEIRDLVSEFKKLYKELYKDNNPDNLEDHHLDGDYSHNVLNNICFIDAGNEEDSVIVHNCIHAKKYLEEHKDLINKADFYVWNKETETIDKNHLTFDQLVDTVKINDITIELDKNSK